MILVIDYLKIGKDLRKGPWLNMLVLTSRDSRPLGALNTGNALPRSVERDLRVAMTTLLA